MQREHLLQAGVLAFAKAAIDLPAEAWSFLAFDRGAGAGAFSHARQAARGHQAGTPDTLTRAKDCSPVWVELKAPGGRPSDAQVSMLKRFRDLGDIAVFGWSIADYRDALVAGGVPLRPAADALVLRHQSHVDAAIVRAEARAADGPAPVRKARPRKPGQPRFVAEKKLTRRINAGRLG